MDYYSYTACTSNGMTGKQYCVARNMIFDLGCYASIALCGRTFAALLRRGFACGFYMQASFRIKDRLDGVRR